MVWIPSGQATLGSPNHYPEERPVYEAELPGFWMDAHPVTNAQFSEFVAATGHVTGAETAPLAKDYPEAPPENLVAGSAVFVPPANPVDLSRPTWWQYVPGANWRHPTGPASSLASLEELPVVHVDYADAQAYANWAGRQLPNEAQWEYAARGGLEQAVYPWGNKLEPNGRRLANYWDGDFPWRNAKDRPPAPNPPGSYPPNGYGLFDMCGSVWEWTTDHYQPYHAPQAATTADAANSTTNAGGAPTACCPPADLSAANPAHPASPSSTTPTTNPAPTTPPPRTNPTPATPPPSQVIKGGSFLCSPDYCARYRPAARFPQAPDTATNHLGFRCILLPDHS